jgi:hypothetical protein
MQELYHVVNALVPVANAFAGTVTTTPINMFGYEHVSFIIQCGAGATGTATVTAEVCSDTSGSNATQIVFNYQECISGDTFGAMTKAPVAGFTTSAAANKMYKIEVDADQLANSGYKYIRLKSVEQTANAICGGILAILTEARFEQEIMDTAIV